MISWQGFRGSRRLQIFYRFHDIKSTTPQRHSVLSIIPVRESWRKAPPLNLLGTPSRSFCPDSFSAAGGAELALLPTCSSQMAAVRYSIEVQHVFSGKQDISR